MNRLELEKFLNEVMKEFTVLHDNNVYTALRYGLANHIKLKLKERFPIEFEDMKPHVDCDCKNKRMKVQISFLFDLPKPETEEP